MSGSDRTLGALVAGLKDAAVEPPAAASLEIAAICDDSRMVGPGALFVALRGQAVDGHDYLAAARARGAAAAVVERRDAPFDGPRVVVPSAARALGRLAARWYGAPAEAMRLTAVTGTNGKTTTTYLVEAILAAAGARPGVVGTVAYRTPAWSRPAPFTTPTPLRLHATLAEMRDAGCTDLVMEASSHALALDRLEGLAFAAAAFTNLTQDHLDFHGTMAAYAEAKARLFSRYLRTDGVAAICVDGTHGDEMIRAAAGRRVLRVSALGSGADVRVLRATPVPAGTALELQTPSGPLSFVSPLVGGFNTENLAVAVGLALGLGLGLDVIAAGLAACSGAPGRLERVRGGDGGPAVYVDYAHTPDALARALAALRPTTRGRLFVVFGCGGDRDRGKRPQMGAIAEAGADRVVLTSDNPRGERPAEILAEIRAGLRAPERVATIEDRRAAIERAVGEATADDVVLIAGKGHEDYQIVGAERRRFDDREEARRALISRG